MKFEIGQRVRIEYGDETFTGIIRGIEFGDYAVEVESNTFYRHNCNGLVENGKGWWIRDTDIVEVLPDQGPEMIPVSEDALFEVLDGE